MLERRSASGHPAIALDQSLARSFDSLGHPVHDIPICFEDHADTRERFPETSFDDGRGCAGAASGICRIALGQALRILRHQGLHHLVEPGGAKLVSGTVRRAPFDSVAPAFRGAIHDRSRLTVVDAESGALCGDYLLEARSIGHTYHVPVIQIEKLRRRPLHVIAAARSLACDAFRIDRGLVPVEMNDDVAERCCSGRCESFCGTSWRKSSFTLDDVHARRIVGETICRRERQTNR